MTLVNYVQTSLEILMNMKLDELQRTHMFRSKEKKCSNCRKKDVISPSSDRFFHSQPGSPKSSSVVSMDVVTCYEKQLIDYEKELRKHIQCEQQMKLHIDSL